jgi:hypothetical protein
MDKTIKLLRNNNYVFNPHVCPSEITIEMLKKEMKCRDLDAMPNIIKEELWNSYFKAVLLKDKFGFYENENDLDKVSFSKESPNVKFDNGKINISKLYENKKK